MATATAEDGLSRTILLVLVALVLLPVLMMVFAVPMMGMMGWWWGGGMVGNGLSPVWGVGMMLVWLVVLVGVGYALYRGLVGRAETGHGDDPALEELRIAYARGELSDQEYEERRTRLQTTDSE